MEKDEGPVKIRTAEPPKPKEPERRERVPFGSPTRKLRAPNDDENYHYHIMNDNWQKEPGRIQRALDAGYQKVEGWNPITVGTNADGSAIKGILMRIPRKFYNEDQESKQRENDRIDEAIKVGKFKEEAGDKRYIPEGIKIWSNQNENG